MTDINLKEYDQVIINHSGGKDSTAALVRMIALAEADNYDYRKKFLISHQCLGEAEWPGTKDLVERQAKECGIRMEVSRYRNRDGEELSLLDYVRKRGKWPDNGNRYCTSEFKRAPGGRVITSIAASLRALLKLRKVKVLNIFGFRAQESPARAKKKVLELNTRQSSGVKEVWDFLPIHDWDESKVWAVIDGAGLERHPAYALGMTRLSCTFCIFAPASQLMIAGRARPDLLDKYCEVEAEIDHTFRKDLALAEIRDRIRAGEEAGEDDGNWNM